MYDNLREIHQISIFHDACIVIKT